MSNKIQDNEILADCAWFADKHRGKNKQSGPHWSTIIRFPRLYDEAVRLQAETERLREALIYISNFADEDTVYMVEQMQEIAQEALKEVKE
jgi:hypothetical protein